MFIIPPMFLFIFCYLLCLLSNYFVYLQPNNICARNNYNNGRSAEYSPQSQLFINIALRMDIRFFGEKMNSK